jgi:hypothetical protein
MDDLVQGCITFTGAGQLVVRQLVGLFRRSQSAEVARFMGLLRRDVAFVGTTMAPILRNCYSNPYWFSSSQKTYDAATFGNCMQCSRFCANMLDYLSTYTANSGITIGEAENIACKDSQTG